MYSYPSFLEFILAAPYFMMLDAIRYNSYLLGTGAVLLGLVYVIFVLSVLYGIFYLVDTMFQPTWRDSAVIKGLSHTPAWTQWVTISTGKTTTIVPIFHPARWQANVIARRQEMACDITPEQYNRLSAKQQVNVILRQGRISRSYYCDQVL